MGEDYIKINLTKPEEISLCGNQVHVIVSHAVFTEDDLGVIFRGEERIACAKAINELLMPGGIFVTNNICPGVYHIESILESEFGFKRFENTPHTGDTFRLQKPF
jgi:hypothetical protein